MKSRILLILIFGFIVGESKVSYENYQLFKIAVKNEDQLKVVGNLEANGVKTLNFAFYFLLKDFVCSTRS